MNRTIAFEKIDDIKNLLIEKYKPEKIILFGSSAWGTEEINDIDLFIVKREVPYYGADRVTELYRMMDIDAAVDFIVYTPEEAQKRLSLGDPFIRKIYRDGKVLYG